MKVQHVSLIPTKLATKAGCPSLTPELMAATGARYSRNNEGLDKIVSKIDPRDPDKSVDSIFRMVDYGHASIADMAPVSMFIDGISIVATTFIFTHSQTGSGQESSTRYIKFDRSGVMSPKTLGIQDEKRYLAHIDKAFAAYEEAMKIWTHEAQKNPAIMKIPKSVTDDKSEAGIKRRDRIVRNFAFDRARYFLPIGVKTNMMLVMSARSWVELISTLLSHPLLELQTIGAKLKKQLALVAPRLIKHATKKADTANVLNDNFELMKRYKSKPGKGDGAFFNMYEGQRRNLKKAAEHRTNRYSMFGDDIRTIPVHFGWEKITFVEMRDLNRHRTGQRKTILKPNGFYDASDQSPSNETKKKLERLGAYGNKCTKMALSKMAKNNHTYIYETLLGHTYHFEHTTTLDKYIYEAELRTGVGAHYRYAEHLRNTLYILYALHPELKGVIKEGRGEPE